MSWNDANLRTPSTPGFRTPSPAYGSRLDASDLTSNGYVPRFGGGGGGGGGGNYSSSPASSRSSGAAALEIRACWEQFVNNDQRIDGMVWTPVIAELCVEKFERQAGRDGYITSRALLELMKTLDWSRIQALETRLRSNVQFDPHADADRRCGSALRYIYIIYIYIHIYIRIAVADRLFAAMLCEVL